MFSKNLFLKKEKIRDITHSKFVKRVLAEKEYNIKTK